MEAGRLLRRFRAKIRYHVKQYHKIDTGLPVGYYDKDSLMLYGCFNLLVDYVEVELAWMQRLGEDEENPIRFWEYWRFRNAELGLKHLDWEMTLADPSLPETERSEPQAKRAAVIRDLYLWWINYRRDLYYKYEPLDDDLEVNRVDEEMLVKLMSVRTSLWT